MFQNQVYGITVLGPKTWACYSGDPENERRGSSRPSPSNPPHISFIHRTLALSEEGPGCPPVTCWSHHYPIMGRTQGPLSFPLLI